ncbi:MAG: hypothetical protein AAF585_20615 [Verrucomicrobiota bacterium]
MIYMGMNLRVLIISGMLVSLPAAAETEGDWSVPEEFEGNQSGGSYFLGGIPEGPARFESAKEETGQVAKLVNIDSKRYWRFEGVLGTYFYRIDESEASSDATVLSHIVVGSDEEPEHILAFDGDRVTKSELAAQMEERSKQSKPEVEISIGLTSLSFASGIVEINGKALDPIESTSESDPPLNGRSGRIFRHQVDPQNYSMEGH